MVNGSVLYQQTTSPPDADTIPNSDSYRIHNSIKLLSSGTNLTNLVTNDLLFKQKNHRCTFSFWNANATVKPKTLLREYQFPDQIQLLNKLFIYEFTREFVPFYTLINRVYNIMDLLYENFSDHIKAGVILTGRNNMIPSFVICELWYFLLQIGRWSDALMCLADANIIQIFKLKIRHLLQWYLIRSTKTKRDQHR